MGGIPATCGRRSRGSGVSGIQYEHATLLLLVLAHRKDFLGRCGEMGMTMAEAEECLAEFEIEAIHYDEGDLADEAAL